VVERVRGDNINSYLLNSELEFKALRAEVPEEIARLLNLNETNLQMQFGRPFLLDSSPGEVAAHFNNVAHLSQIDSGLRNVQGWMRQLETDISSDEGRLVELQGDLEEYKGLEEIEGRLIVLENLEQKRGKAGNRLRQLQDLLRRLGQAEEEISRYKHVLKAEQHLSDLLSLQGKRGEVADRCKALRTLVDREGGLSVAIERSKEEAERLEKEFKDAFPDVCPLCLQTVERWKPITISGFEGLYEVSNLGRVRSYCGPPNKKETSSIPTLRIQGVDKDGYKRVGLYAKKRGLKPMNVPVHRLVLETFVGPCPQGTEGSHIDGDTANNRLDNLCWESHFDNEQRKNEHGTRWFKEPTLTPEEVEQIRSQYIPRKNSQRALGEKYGVCEDTILKVINYKTPYEVEK
jgi:hypothetical protein